MTSAPFNSEAGFHLPVPDPGLGHRLRLQGELGLRNVPDPALDTLAEKLAGATGAPYAMVNLIGVEQYFIGLHSPAPGSDLPQVDRSMSLEDGYCPNLLSRRKSLVLRDVYAFPRFAGNAVVDRLGIRRYAGAPLIHTDGTVLGTVCVVGPEPTTLDESHRAMSAVKYYRDQALDLIHRKAGPQRG